MAATTISPIFGGRGLACLLVIYPALLSALTYIAHMLSL